MSRDLDEDMIEATIRRVAASKAARLPDLPPGADESPDAPGDEAEAGRGATNLHIVPPTDADANPEAGSDAGRPIVDESRIEATLRRIEAEQAERAPEGAIAIAPPESPAASPGAVHVQSELGDRPEPIAFPPREESWRAAARELRRDLDDTRRQLASLTARVDTMLSGQPQPAPAAVARDQTPAEPQSGAEIDEWDDAPQLPRFPIGAPPRPAILRDAPSTMATESRSDDDSLTAAPASAESASAAPDAKRGFDLLPRTYRITVEDKRRGVDLVPLHRALLGMAGVRDMSLLSYSNGTAIVALEATAEIDPDVLGDAVSRAMAREVKVEVHNEQTMVIKLAED